jgi:hypothetical protein
MKPRPAEKESQEAQRAAKTENKIEVSCQGRRIWPTQRPTKAKPSGWHWTSKKTDQSASFCAQTTPLAKNNFEIRPFPKQHARSLT